MVCKVQRPISIPEPTNDVDSLWRTTQVLKEVVEIMQGIRGNREYALKCDLDDLNSEVTNITVVGSGGGGGTGDLEFGGSQYDMLYNTDGTTWGPTVGELQWNPDADTLQLSSNSTISWLNTSGSAIEFLDFEPEVSEVTTEGDPYWPFVVMSLPFTGVQGGTDTTDVSDDARPDTWIGSTMSLDLVDGKQGAAALVNDGSVSYIEFPTSIDLDLQDQLWTIEFWYKFDTVKDTVFCSKWDTIPGRSWYIAYISGTAELVYGRSTNGTNQTQSDWPWTPTTGVWYHIVVERGANNWTRGFIDGVRIGANQVPTEPWPTSANFRIGATVNAGVPAGMLDGRMAGFRYTAGAARYDGDSVTGSAPNFTPPTEPFPISELSGETVVSGGKFIVGDRSYPVAIEAQSVNMLEDTPFRWEYLGTEVEFLNFENSRFDVGSPFFPTELEGTLIGLKNSIGINWDNALGDNVEHLNFVTSGVAGAPMDYYAEVNVDLAFGTTSTAGYVDVTGGLDYAQTNLVNGDEYFLYHSALVYNESNATVAFYRLTQNDVGLVGSDEWVDGGADTGTAATAGKQYIWTGTITAGATGNLKNEAATQNASFQTVVQADQTLLLNLSDVPNHVRDVHTGSLFNMNGTINVWNDTPLIAASVPAGDALVIWSCAVTYNNTAGNDPQFAIEAGAGGSTFYGGTMRIADSDTRRANCGGMMILEGFAGGDVTVQYKTTSTTNYHHLEYGHIMVIPLSDFGESHFSQVTDNTERFLAATTTEETLISATNAVGASSDWIPFAWFATDSNSSNHHPGLAPKVNIDAAGITEVGAWGADYNEKWGFATSHESVWTEMGTAQTYTEGQSVELLGRGYQKTATTNGYRNEGVLMLKMSAPSTLTEQFIVGDPAYQTEIDGTLIGLKNSIGVNWDNIAGDNTELLVFDPGGTEVPADPDFASVVLLLPFEEAGGSTSTTGKSLSAHPSVTFGGDAVIEAGTGPFGDNCVTFDGTGDYVQFAVDDDYKDFLELEFTIEFHIWLDNNTSDACYICVDEQVNDLSWYIGHDAVNDSLSVEFSENGSGKFYRGSGAATYTPATGQWYHVAVVLDDTVASGNRLRKYVDGVQIGTAQDITGFSFGFASVNTPLFLGARQNDGGAATPVNPLNGKIANVRITRNVCRYPDGTTFTPPAAPYGQSATETTLIGADETFFVGDPAYPTQIDGTLTTVTGNLNVNGTTDLDGTVTAPSATLSDDLTLVGTLPQIVMNENDQAADEGLWRIRASGSSYSIQARNDLDSGGSIPLVIARTGTVIDSITLAGTAVTVSGALSATSYGGITEANLLDKSAAELIAGQWQFSADLYGSSGFSIQGATSDIGQVGQIAFVDVSGGLGRFGSYNYDLVAWQPVQVHGSTLDLDGDSSVDITSAGLTTITGSQVTLEHGGIKVGSTHADGMNVWDAVGAAPFIGFYNDTPTRQGYVQFSSSVGGVIKSEVHGAPVSLVGEDTATGADQTLIDADPDGAARLFYNGSSKLATLATGVAITGLASATTYFQLPTYTDTQLNDVTATVNTDAGKVQGAMVYNSTQDVPVYAVGNADGSVWVDGAGTTVNTPV